MFDISRSFDIDHHTPRLLSFRVDHGLKQLQSDVSIELGVPRTEHGGDRTLGDHLFQPIAIDQKFSEQAIRIDASAHATIIILRGPTGTIANQFKGLRSNTARFETFRDGASAMLARATRPLRIPLARGADGTTEVRLSQFALSRFDVRTIQPGV